MRSHWLGAVTSATLDCVVVQKVPEGRGTGLTPEAHSECTASLGDDQGALLKNSVREVMVTLTFHTQ